MLNVYSSLKKDRSLFSALVFNWICMESAPDWTAGSVDGVFRTVWFFVFFQKLPFCFALVQSFLFCLFFPINIFSESWKGLANSNYKNIPMAASWKIFLLYSSKKQEIWCPQSIGIRKSFRNGCQRVLWTPFFKHFCCWHIFWSYFFIMQWLRWLPYSLLSWFSYSQSYMRKRKLHIQPKSKPDILK